MFWREVSRCSCGGDDRGKMVVVMVCVCKVEFWECILEYFGLGGDMLVQR